MRDKYCRNCGRMIGDGWLFCMNCGSPLSHPQAKPTPSYDQIMEKYYHEMLSCFADSVFHQNASYELIPFLYVAGDLTLLSVKKDRLLFAKSVAPYGLPSLLPNRSKDDFDRRMNFYAKVVQSGYVWGQWSPVDIPDHILQNSIFRCLVACGDIIMNAEDCLADYESAPLLLIDVFEKTKIYAAMMQLFQIVPEYCKAIDKSM